MKPRSFGLFLFLTPLLGVALIFKGMTLFLPLFAIFVLLPLADYFSGPNTRNPTAEETLRWVKPSHYMSWLVIYFVFHFVFLFYGAQVFTNTLGWEKWMIAVLVGTFTGGLGITVAHELSHKRKFIPQRLADLLLSSVMYQHFVVEHVRGHHARVSTPEDPASARFGENAYFFVIRSIFGSFAHALELDAPRVIKGVLLEAVWIGGFAYWAGMDGVLYFLIQAMTAILLLELVNYTEHYGLTRKMGPNGRYERVLPRHSWNASYPFSSALLFNLQRHSDHHAEQERPYTILRHQTDAPQLPAGYPTMVLLALFPPLWFRVIHPKIAASVPQEN